MLVASAKRYSTLPWSVAGILFVLEVIVRRIPFGSILTKPKSSQLSFASLVGHRPVPFRYPPDPLNPGSLYLSASSHLSTDEIAA